MLIEFAVTNYRSFHERQVLSLLPSGKIRERKVIPIQADEYAKLQVLPSAVLYGPNNSGKSNFLKAIKTLYELVKNSGNHNSNKKLVENEFFEFALQSKNQPTKFEIDFIAPNKKRYNYTVSFNRNQITEENLYVYTISQTGKTTVNTLYERSEQNIKFVTLKGVKESVNFSPNQLFLSRGDIDGNKELKEVYSFFSNCIEILNLTEDGYTNFSTNIYPKLMIEKQSKSEDKLLDTILREINVGIVVIKNIALETDNLTYKTLITHKLFDDINEVGTFDLPLKEQSTGTQKLVTLLAFIILILKSGDCLFIDEMSTSMHTEITAWLIDLFNNPLTNPNKAQLIITTHDITLIDKELYEKDQIFVVEKNKYGASEMYSFADITGLPRNNNRLSDYYETGRMGGVPHISKSYLQHEISQFLKDAEAEAQ
ncbi:MAG: hypothetical protein RLZZ292_4032 [Bacteroidota bacterium]|jgi:AAA15 family ATPase/GTPase